MLLELVIFQQTYFLQEVMLTQDQTENYMGNLCLSIILSNNKILLIYKKYPNKRIMLIAEKGTMGVGSSRMSGVNNVALWIGKKQAHMFHSLILHQ